MNIGLTGGIACGKSTVSALLQERGAFLIDADKIAREVVLPGQPAWVQIVDRFGRDILLEDQSIHRRKLGDLIFQNEQARLDLQAITHPHIRAEMRRQMEEAQTHFPDRLTVVDVPLLIESKLQSMFEKVVIVYVDQQVQLERLMKRDEMSLEQAVHRLNSQMPIEEKKKYADVLINNNGTIEETIEQVEQLLLQLGFPSVKSDKLSR